MNLPSFKAVLCEKLYFTNRLCSFITGWEHRIPSFVCPSLALLAPVCVQSSGQLWVSAAPAGPGAVGAQAAAHSSVLSYLCVIRCSCFLTVWFKVSGYQAGSAVLQTASAVWGTHVRKAVPFWEAAYTPPERVYMNDEQEKQQKM